MGVVNSLIGMLVRRKDDAKGLLSPKGDATTRGKLPVQVCEKTGGLFAI